MTDFTAWEPALLAKLASELHQQNKDLREAVEQLRQDNKDLMKLLRELNK